VKFAKDLTVIFFTDGQDTCNDTKKINTSLDAMKTAIANQHIQARFLTIGFSKGHDAAFLNQIANAGTELGNFFYVDVSQSGYQEQISECL